jgi:hypothetical protein
MKTDPIETRAVVSSNIGRVGFDWKSATLAVGFKKNGWVYHYAPVPKPLVARFMRNEHPGVFFAKFIRDNPSIQTYLFCNCGQYVIDGTHLETCVESIRKTMGKEASNG